MMGRFRRDKDGNLYQPINIKIRGEEYAFRFKGNFETSIILEGGYSVADLEKALVALKALSRALNP